MTISVMRRIAVVLVMAAAAAATEAQEVRRPTVETTNPGAADCTGTYVYSSAPNFYDSGGEATSSMVSQAGLRNYPFRWSGDAYSSWQ